jgi:Tol biopolymer transport system component
MKKPPKKNIYYAVATFLLIISLFVGFGCDFDLGGNPINGDDDNNEDTQCTAEVVERVSINSNASQADGNSHSPSISSDGRFVAFISEATNLVLDDTNEVEDVFVHDRTTGNTQRVSIASDGSEADDESITVSLSADGSFAAFGSSATNLAFNDTNGAIDIFVHDLDTSVTDRVSVASNGAEANDDSFYVDISSDGRFVAFMSDATNLVLTDTNQNSDIFVHDRQTGVTERVSVSSNGTQANGNSMFSAISSDGRYVTFSSEASNLVADDINGEADIFVHDRERDITELKVGPAVFDSGSGVVKVAPVLSPNGNFVGFRSPDDDLVIGDTNNSVDTFLINRETENIERISLSSSEVQGNSDSSNPSLDADDRFVAFSSIATNLVSNDTNGVEDVFVRD